jgi:hypothetical protein
MAKKQPTNWKEVDGTLILSRTPSFGTQSRGPGNAPQIRYNRPEVAKHWARMIIGCNMDTEAAVAKGWSEEYPDATEAQIVAMARTLEEAPAIKREIDAQLEEIGFGKEAQKKFIGLLWKEVLGGNDKRFPVAARLLAEITQALKARDRDKVMPKLQLAGMEEGLTAMLGPDKDNGAEVTMEQVLAESGMDPEDIDDDATGKK